MIKMASELREVQNKMDLFNNEISELKKELIKIGENQKIIHDLQKRKDELLRNLHDFDKYQIKKEINIIENELKIFNDQLKSKNERITELENMIKNYDNDLEKIHKDEEEFLKLKNSDNLEEVLNKRIKEAHNLYSQKQSEIDKTNKDIHDIDYNIQNLNKTITELKDEIKSENESINKKLKEIEDIEKLIIKNNKELEDIEVSIYNKKAEQSKDKKQLDELNQKKVKYETESNGYKNDLKNLEEKIKKYDIEINESQNQINQLKIENEWIESEMNFFNMKNTDYDFSKINIKEENIKLNKLKEENNVLKRKVNMKVETMADQYDKEYENLIKKKEIITKDKMRIKKAIEELDQKRLDALQKVFQVTNNSLDKIYSELLPGTGAKLEQVDENDLMKGVQLRVSFNGAWVQSLSQLSGGQISLLALSLILSLLRYKPAPIYIFDEIDAALDLNHTQNLGTMLKRQFPESQFLVISLKDGLFTNANVLYKVSYSEGSSRIERLTKSNL